MSNPPPAKRARASAATDDAHHSANPDFLAEALQHLPPQHLKGLITQTFLRHPDALIPSLAERSKAPARNFDHLSKSCWKELNITHKRLSLSQQYQISGEVSEVLESACGTILKGVTESPRYESKLSGLETLRKISKSILLCDLGQIRHEIMGGGSQTIDVISNAMVSILNTLNDGEREKFGQEEELIKGIKWVNNEMERYSIEEYAKVVAILDGMLGI
uniref:Uncharacterized protein n=1 Tax=Kwoniella dejecticola CBS 10117 TaxID=1296121 RepID=A0A1A6A4Z2_9TREE|nr:uncharacterized protein I303_04464 [Kwoniella dejecticola CBS 10117]OBR85132.1 hypothetical protein I303_04464 [Kwoniella dejecticola CBS 10117]